jgi:hypothetical protein
VLSLPCPGSEDWSDDADSLPSPPLLKSDGPHDPEVAAATTKKSLHPEQGTDPKPPAADEDEFVDEEMSMSDGNTHKPPELNAGYEQTTMPNKKKKRRERERAEQARTGRGGAGAAATDGAGAGFGGWNIQFNDELAAGFGSLVITATDSDAQFQGFSDLPPQQTPTPSMFQGEDASDMTCPVPSNALFHAQVRDGTLLFAITFVWTAPASDDVVQTVYVGMPVHQAAVDMAMPEGQYIEAMKRAMKILYEEELELFVKVVMCHTHSYTQ